MTLSGLFRHCTYVVHIHTSTKHLYTENEFQIKKIKNTMPSYMDLSPVESYPVSDTSVHSNIPFVIYTPTYK